MVISLNNSDILAINKCEIQVISLTFEFFFVLVSLAGPTLGTIFKNIIEWVV